MCTTECSQNRASIFCATTKNLSAKIKQPTVTNQNSWSPYQDFFRRPEMHGWEPLAVSTLHFTWASRPRLQMKCIDDPNSSPSNTWPVYHIVCFLRIGITSVNEASSEHVKSIWPTYTRTFVHLHTSHRTYEAGSCVYIESYQIVADSFHSSNSCRSKTVYTSWHSHAVQ